MAFLSSHSHPSTHSVLMKMDANRTCRQGHISPAGSQFCNTCGEPLPPHHADIPVVPLATSQPASALPAPTPYQPLGMRSDLSFCRGCGKRYERTQYVCESCQTIKPISVDHHVDPTLFQWALDGKAMEKLRSLKPLVAMAQKVSNQVGRPWIEATFNGIRLSTRQMPHVYAMATQAARLLGLDRMPSIYVSGTRPWDAMTFGSNDDAFIVMGSALVSCFKKSDLMFLFAREMGHVLAGHALWKTVIQFCVGHQHATSSMMRNGVVGLLDPFRLVEGALEMPLIAWARQAEITADRAGMLVAAGLEQARRIMMIWSLRSPMLYRQINMEAWLEQQAEDTSSRNIRLAEAVSSSTPYLTRRVRLLEEYDQSPVVKQFRQHILKAIKEEKQQAPTASAIPTVSAAPTDHAIPTAPAAPFREEATTEPSLPQTSNAPPVRFRCPNCEKPIGLSSPTPDGKQAFAVRCPNPSCRKIIRLRRPSLTPPPFPANTPETTTDQETLSQMSE